MSGTHRPSSQREQDTRSRKDRDSPKRSVLGDNDSIRPYPPRAPDLLGQDSWVIEKQFIAERRLQLHQQLNEDIQKLGDQYFTDTTKLDQKKTVLGEGLRATLRYSSRLLEDIPVSPSTTSPYIHLSAPSPAIYENVPWSWPPLTDQRTLGVMTGDQTPLFQTNSTIIHECAPAVVQPRTSVGPAVRMVETNEGEDRGYQSDASSSTMSLHNQPAQSLSPYSVKSTSTSTSRRGRHSSAIIKELDTYGKKPASDSETDDSPTGMYIPVVIHDKARGFRRRTK